MAMPKPKYPKTFMPKVKVKKPRSPRHSLGKVSKVNMPGKFTKIALSIRASKPRTSSPWKGLYSIKNSKKISGTKTANTGRK